MLFRSNSAILSASATQSSTVVSRAATMFTTGYLVQHLLIVAAIFGVLVVACIFLDCGTNNTEYEDVEKQKRSERRRSALMKALHAF